MSQGRYRTEQLRRAWNRLAKADRKIDKDGRQALRDECQQRHAATGKREIEMSCWDARDGVPHILEF